MNKLRIEMTSHGRGRVWLDDVEVTNIKAVSFWTGVDELNTVMITMSVAQIDCIAEEVEVTNMSDTDRRFAKAIKGIAEAAYPGVIDGH